MQRAGRPEATIRELSLFCSEVGKKRVGRRELARRRHCGAERSDSNSQSNEHNSVTPSRNARLEPCTVAYQGLRGMAKHHLNRHECRGGEMWSPHPSRRVQLTGGQRPGFTQSVTSPLLCPCFLGVCCTLKPGVCRLSQVIRRAVRGYIGLQIRHPGFESRWRLSSHPAASCGTKVSNACDSLDYGIIRVFCCALGLFAACRTRLCCFSCCVLDRPPFSQFQGQAGPWGSVVGR